MPSDQAEDVKRVSLLLAEEAVTGLADEVGHVDHRQRVGAFQHENSANRDASERLFRTQNGQRAVQPAQIEGCFIHARILPEVPDCLTARLFQNNLSPRDLSGSSG